MVKNKLYKDGYSLGEMIDRVIYWWARYEGKRTEDGKDYDLGELRDLISRLERLRKNPNKFKFSKPDMEEHEQ